MASKKILEAKEETVKTIEKAIKDSESVILFKYQGLTVSEISELRSVLRDQNGELKIYKNTLVKRALDNLKIDMEPSFLEGPNASVFGKDLLEPIKVLNDFVKNHDKAEIRIGIISGDIAPLATILEYANIPSREGLLTQLAGGMIEYVRELAIALNLYADKLEK